MDGATARQLVTAGKKEVEGHNRCCRHSHPNCEREKQIIRRPVSLSDQGMDAESWMGRRCANHWLSRGTTASPTRTARRTEVTDVHDGCRQRFSPHVLLLFRGLVLPLRQVLCCRRSLIRSFIRIRGSRASAGRMQVSEHTVT